jgi:formylglycine-generating enzyme required for sulfatase activity
MGVGWGWLLNMADVAFISYRRLPSFSLASLIQEKLKNTHQINTYVDVTRADGARVQFPERLMQAIADATLFVCLLGEGTLDSEWVLKEIREAHRLEKPCIPVFQEKFPKSYKSEDPSINYLLAHEAVHVLDVSGIYIDEAVAKLTAFINKTLGSPIIAPYSTIKPVKSTANFDIHEAIDRYNSAMNAEQWYDARDILKEITSKNQVVAGFNLKQEWEKIMQIIVKFESDTAHDTERNRAYMVIMLRHFRSSMAELKDALNNLWRTYPDYDPSHLVKPRPYEWVKIPAGYVILLDVGGYLKELTSFDVPAFEIGKYPVTVAQYDEFIQDGGYQNVKWWDGLDRKLDSPMELPEFSRPDHPRVNVNWFEAIAYCRWLSAKLDKIVTLPIEQQWQRAAQGDDNRTYPWGYTWEEGHCNTLENRLSATTRVNYYEGKGDSPYEVVDMAGNVWEWCLTNYVTGGVEVNSDASRTLRGGSWNQNLSNARTTSRGSDNPKNNFYDYGFRVVIG